MQEKEQKISPIKQRILQFADNLNISKREFYAKIGVSRGTLESKTGITEDVLAKFIATFPDVSIEWLMQGKGRMKVDKEVVDNVATDTTVGMILHRDEQLIRENERPQQVVSFQVKSLPPDIEVLPMLLPLFPSIRKKEDSLFR